jgi:hypothetical protein
VGGIKTLQQVTIAIVTTAVLVIGHWHMGPLFRKKLYDQAQHQLIDQLLGLNWRNCAVQKYEN